MPPRVSIIVRTKDEERWISHCLDRIFRQDYKDFEVILVDNESSDKTLEKARPFALAKVLACREYRPGRALNLGIRQAGGAFIACLSGHCLPVNDQWLGTLMRNFEEPSVAGVYGRQEAMSFTPDADKRDLLLLFGLDRRVQRKDSFFHNANSMIRRDVWEQVPFDETVTNIEDRVWAQQVLALGRTVIYEPEASVYHHHGVHHSGNVERCANVVKILEQLHGEAAFPSLDIERLNTMALIPVRGPVQRLSGRPLLAYTIQRAREARAVKRVVVSTDSPEVARLAAAEGAEAPFLRDPELSRDHVGIAQVLQHSLERLEGLGLYPDLVVSLEVTFPLRPPGLLDDMIGQLVRDGLDSVVAAKPENRAVWMERDQSVMRLVEGLTPRQLKDPTFIELRGVGCVTHPEFVRQGLLLGPRLGIYQVDNPYSHLEVRSDQDLQMASRLIDACFDPSLVATR